MAKGTVEKVTFFSSWEYQGKQNHNFVVKFKDSEDRFVYVGQDKDNPKFKEGLELEYKLDGRKIKGNIGTHQFEYEKISPVQAQGGGYGGGGGNKNQPQTPEQIKNGLVSYLGGYVKDIICHKINVCGNKPEEIVAAYETMLDGFLKASVRHIK